MERFYFFLAISIYALIATSLYIRYGIQFSVFLIFFIILLTIPTIIRHFKSKNKVNE